MKNWLKAALIEYLGIDRLRDRVIDLDNELGEVESFVKFPTPKIRAGKITAGAITTDKLRFIADKLAEPESLPPISGYTYRLRNRQIAGPIIQQGPRFGVPNWVDTWDYLGHHYSNDRMMDLVEVISTPLEDELRRAPKTEELTQPWKTASMKLGPQPDLIEADRLKSMRAGETMSDYNRGYHDGLVTAMMEHGR